MVWADPLKVGSGSQVLMVGWMHKCRETLESRSVDL